MDPHGLFLGVDDDEAEWDDDDGESLMDFLRHGRT